MSKPKIKIGISYLVLVIVCLLCSQFLLLINYTLALLLHELAHYYIAKSKGYKVGHLKLDLLGMKLKISDNIDKNDHFWIAFAGPIVNFILCILCTALWWIIPESFYFSSAFFQANLILALFNILPIEPLDGGVMLNCLLNKANKKVSKVISKIVNILFIIVFVLLFFISLDNEPNLILLMFAIFFVVNLIKNNKKQEYENYTKFLLKKNLPISKVNLVKISSTTTLFDCFKQIKSNQYTVFYYETKKCHITENDLQLLLTKYDLQTKIIDLIDKI